ncbi:hypothetical protein PRZ48_008263 [Zasmidium cellare]|uniref:PinX1-related protein 1 n=1 Tax=Zasmidium cellare TaxID=395010 RepID=A0ABR0EF24_ZASCE|nr:hypothetical protein PRZ48_008263 [Zasmidium cellare]
MGLSGNKKRSKLSEDPNNTAWSKNTTNFGHKILSKQGWKQGDYLGAENANHSAHFTAANASHIRVMLREDNLGLGAQVGKGNAETFGLSMFSGLLGRLNGKSDEEVQKKQDTLRDAELRTYQANKYGFMNFVRGGLLVGDKMEFPESTKIEDIKKTSKSVEAEPKQSKKRKAGEEADEIESSKKRRKGQAVEESAEKRTEKSKKRKSDSEEESQSKSSDSESSEEVDAREEKRRRKERRKAEKAAKTSKEPTEVNEDDEKVRLKAEKRALKEERRKRREEKRSKRAAKKSATTSKQTSTVTSESEGTATPPITNGGLTMTGGRHAVRQRYIMQKRMASMNATALKEIFMLQPQPAS